MNPSSNQPTLVLLGVGRVARAVASLVGESKRVVGTTRSRRRETEMESAGIRPVVAEELTPEVVGPLVAGADVLVSFPPDGRTDARVAPACRNARSIVYVSSTGVYGAWRGRVDDETPVARDEPQAAPRLAAEDAWRAAGAVVLRAPGIYGSDTGLHVRLASGRYRIPGDGSGVISRIHVEDLARLVLAAFECGRRGTVFVVGDLAPASQIEVVSWLCERMGLPLPPHAPLDEVHLTMRGSRAIDPAHALAELGVVLRYPTYREGFSAALAAGRPRNGL